MACVGDPALNDVEAIDACGSFITFLEASEKSLRIGFGCSRTYGDDCGNMTRDTVMLIPNDFPACNQFLTIQVWA
jgi:hypothetical protein